jgi:hypothetical protein
MTNAFKITRQISKSTNRPPGPTWMRQLDFDFDFNPEPKAGETLFHVPRHNQVIHSVDHTGGTAIDLGLDWGGATLSFKNPIISRTFFNELVGYLDQNPTAYNAYLTRDYTVTNEKGEQWSVDLNSSLIIKYLATVPWQTGKDISGPLLGNNDFIRSSYLWASGAIYRIWTDINGYVNISNDLNWVTSTIVGTGTNANASVDSNGNIYVTWEQSGLIKYRIRDYDDGYAWSAIGTVNQLQGSFILANPTVVGGAVYSQSFPVAVDGVTWIFYVKTIDGADSICYALSSQDFKFEHPIPGPDGAKSDLFVYLNSDQRLNISWSNCYNGVSNIIYMFTNVVQKSYVGIANHSVEDTPSDSIILMIHDIISLKLIKV